MRLDSRLASLIKISPPKLKVPKKDYRSTYKRPHADIHMHKIVGSKSHGTKTTMNYCSSFNCCMPSL